VEAELRASEEKFRMVVENTLDGIMIVALDGRILYSNQANAHIFEITPGSVRTLGSKNIMDVPYSVLPRAGTGRSKKGCRRDRWDPDRIPGQSTVTGRPIWIEVVGKRVSYQNEPAIVISVKDITSRKQMERAILQGNKKLQPASSITRHDINNQLVVLDSYIDMIRTKNTSPDCRDYFSRIEEASGQITSMIRFYRGIREDRGWFRSLAEPARPCHERSSGRNVRQHRV